MMPNSLYYMPRYRYRMGDFERGVSGTYAVENVVRTAATVIEEALRRENSSIYVAFDTEPQKKPKRLLVVTPQETKYIRVMCNFNAVTIAGKIYFLAGEQRCYAMLEGLLHAIDDTFMPKAPRPVGRPQKNKLPPLPPESVTALKLVSPVCSQNTADELLSEHNDDDDE